MKQTEVAPEGKDALKFRIETLLASNAYRPEKASGIFRQLELPEQDRSRFGQVLKELEHEGKIERVRGGRYVPSDAGVGGRQSSKRAPVTGVLRVRRNGSGFVVLGEGALIGEGVRLPQGVSVQIARGTMRNALAGDTVELSLRAKRLPAAWLDDPAAKHRILDLEAPGDLAIEGSITKVVERAAHRVIGTIRRKGKRLIVEPDSCNYPSILELSGHLVDGQPVNGERVVVEVVSWEQPDCAPQARLMERLGMPEEGDLALREIIAVNGIREPFPEAVLDEARAIAVTIPETEIRAREDWRDRLVFTIDPGDARDFDDAISIHGLEGGGWELAVHIADVSTYVKPGSALDEEARIRGNSTYLPQRVIPMLPEELSNGICSLLPLEDRLTRCVVMQFDREGVRRKTRFVSAVIHSKSRLTYEQAMQYIDGTPASQGDHVPAAIREAWKLACLLRQRRFRKGALDLEFPEVRVKMDASGRPVDLVVSEYDASHQLIEECMLVANEAVAEELRNRGRPCIYRVHEDPSEERLLEFREMARAAGFKVGDLSERAHVQKLLDQAKGHAAEQAIKIGLLKSLKRADYRAEPVGHYGLAKRDYTHFTSPIRRYADLVVHRALFAGKGEPRIKLTEAAGVAAHISATERASARAEQESQRMAQYAFLASIAEREPQRTFAATVMECAAIGLFVEIDTWQLRGLIHGRDLPGHHVYFDRAAACYRGLAGGGNLRVGDGLWVMLKTVDLAAGKLDFHYAGRSKEPNRRNPRSRSAAKQSSRAGSSGKRGSVKSGKKKSSRNAARSRKRKA